MTGSGAPRTVVEFMAYACAMEAEAAQRYEDLADLMAAHNNREIAELFGKLARIEALHRDQIMNQMGWTTAPPSHTFEWTTPEGPETTDHGDLHYLMQPYHALKLAEHNERRAVEFFAAFATADLPGDVRSAAAEMADEEREHVRLIESWLMKVTAPAEDWAEDLDPPNVVD
jgi:rubrerythrin